MPTPPDSMPAIVCALAALGLSLSMALVFLLRICLRASHPILCAILLWPSRILPLLVVAAFTAASVLHPQELGPSAIERLLSVEATGLAVIAAWCLQAVVFRWQRPGKLIGWLGVGLVGGLCLLISRWTQSEFHRQSVAVQVLELTPELPGDPSPVAGIVAQTDRGDPIQLLAWRVDDELANQIVDSARAPRQSHLVRGSADLRANCHGWVFTGGQFVLSAQSVEQILRDNTYASVSNPLPGDLIIYRNSSGQILHSGLVRGVLNDGTIIIESKFGAGGRFLHLPNDQPFSSNYQYFRTARGHHTIEMPLEETKVVEVGIGR